MRPLRPLRPCDGHVGIVFHRFMPPPLGYGRRVGVAWCIQYTFPAPRDPPFYSAADRCVMLEKEVPSERWRAFCGTTVTRAHPLPTSDEEDLPELPIVR